MFQEYWFGRIISITTLVLVLAGCASRSAAGRAETNEYRFNQFVIQLRGMGLQGDVTAEDGAPLINPNVVVRVIEIAGSGLSEGADSSDAEVQVYEYPDEETREADSSAIAPSGSPIGDRYVSWLDQPNFWAAGRLIVLYVGREREVLDLLSTVLGQPITEPSFSTP